MYDEELNMALEDAFDEGYYQALIDMGIDPEDIAEEDVDIFDDDYFEGVEGAARDYRRAQNVGKTGDQIRAERRAMDRDAMIRDPKAFKRHNQDAANRWNRESYLKNVNQGPQNIDPRTRHGREYAEKMMRDPERIARIQNKLDASSRRNYEYNKNLDHLDDPRAARKMRGTFHK